MLTKCIWCHKRPIQIKRSLLCNACHQYRQIHGTLKTEKDFVQRLVKRYGRKIIDDLEMLKKNPAWTLQKVGEKYGFTREYVRQIYKAVFGYPYSQDRIIKSNLYLEETSCPSNPKTKVAAYESKKNSGYIMHAKAELDFVNQCKSFNFNIDYRKGYQKGVIVNGYKVVVRLCNVPRKLSPKSNLRYCIYRLNDKQKEDCDFVACYHIVYDAFFIIPVEECSNFTIHIADKESDFHSAKNRFHKYKNAWELLEKKKE